MRAYFAVKMISDKRRTDDGDDTMMINV